MRLFIGIALSRDAADALAAVQERFAPIAQDLRWSQPENWHVTLQFLGSSTNLQAACVAEKLATIHAKPVPFQIAKLGFFERAGVFWAGVDLTPELLALQQEVVTTTRGCGFVPEDRAYNPHITLARAKGRNGGRTLAPLRAAVERTRIVPTAEFVAQEFLLFESSPGPEGSRYEVRARFPLSARRSGGPHGAPSHPGSAMTRIRPSPKT